MVLSQLYFSYNYLL